MLLTGLQIEAIRNIRSAQFSPSAGIVLFEGENGAGKTSLLEAISLLSTGSSFRSRKSTELLQHDQSALRVIGRLQKRDGQKHVLGLQFNADGTQLQRIDGQNTARRAELTRLLPTLVITPEHNQLVAGGPGERRRFMDWGVFHVEHDFYSVWRNYHQALNQRNALIRRGSALDQRAAWDHELAKWGEQWNAIRLTHVRELAVCLQQVLASIEVFPAIELRYRRGWSEQATLLDSLRGERVRPGPQSRTQHGPHLADVELLVEAGLAKQFLSRGQQKLLVYGLKLAQLQVFLRANPAEQCLILCDDLPAELDGNRREQVVDLLRTTGCQTFITSSEKDAIQRPNSLFHVEHGEVSQVL
jgi:DNA replication and repair protein RecF